MIAKQPKWAFFTQVLSRALNELESACIAEPETKEFKFYRAEAPIVLEEAREALAALKHYVQDLEAPKPSDRPPTTRH